MARKTYIPMAVYWANGLYNRLTKYQETLSADKTTDQLVALANLIACLATFLREWRNPPPAP